MALISKKASVRWNSKSKKFYVDKGYSFTKIGDEFMVKVEDLSRYSTAIIKVECDFCGKIVDKTYFNYMNSKEKTKTYYDSCKECGQKKAVIVKKLSFKEIHKRFSDKGYKLISHYDEYVNQSSKLKFICLEHPHEIQFTTIQSIHSQGGCGFCAIESRRNHFKHDIEFIKQEFKKKGYVLLSIDYINAHSPLKYICVNHADIGIQETSYLNLYTNDNNCRQCYIEHMRKINIGDNNPLWNPNRTYEERLDKRSYYEYIEFRKKVFERDDYTCQCCGYKGRGLNAHHKDGYHWCKERRTDIDNGVTLCDTCHKDFHDKYGKKNNTEEQYNEWILKIESA